MAEEAKAPAKRAKKGAGTRSNEKPVSLHPLTLEEAVDKLFKVQPSQEKPDSGSRRGAKRQE
jgi:hypothetical protein